MGLLEVRAGGAFSTALEVLALEFDDEDCCFSAIGGLGGNDERGFGGNEARGGEKAAEKGDASFLIFGRGGARGDDSRTTGFLGSDKSLPRTGLGWVSASSLRFFEALAPMGRSRSENSDSFPSSGRFLRLKEGNVGGGAGTGRGDARSLIRGFSSVVLSRSRMRSRSRSRGRSSRRLSAAREVLEDP